jgi:hypothetical protein
MTISSVWSMVDSCISCVRQRQVAGRLVDAAPKGAPTPSGVNDLLGVSPVNGLAGWCAPPCLTADTLQIHLQCVDDLLEECVDLVHRAAAPPLLRRGQEITS